MANAVSKIIDAVAESYNGTAKVKYNKKNYGRVDGPLTSDVAATIVTQLNNKFDLKYSGVNWT